MRDLSDRELVAQFRDGGEKRERAFAELQRRYEGLVRYVARRVLDGQQADHDDACQTAWLRVLELLPTLQNARNIKAWIAVVAAHAIRNFRRRHVRQSRPQQLTPELEESWNGATARHDDAAAIRQDVREVAQCLARVGEVVPMLMLTHGGDTREVAKQSKLSRRTVELRWRAVREVFKAVLVDERPLPESIQSVFVKSLREKRAS